MANLVLLSYGRENEYKRAILTVLSHYAWVTPGAGAKRVIIFTDSPDYMRPYLAGLNVEYILLTPEKLREFKGPANFIHRLKVAIINNAFELHPDSALLYLDSDTFFLNNSEQLLASITQDTSVMHTKEFALETRRNEDMGKPLLNLLESQRFSTTKGVETFHGGHCSWNAGVIGMSKAMAASMPDVFQLTDLFFEASNWHISEQLAFSLILQTRSKVLPAEHTIYHYWSGSEKTAVDALLSNLLDLSFATKSLNDKLNDIKKFVEKLPYLMKKYLREHPHIKLEETRARALYSFQIKDFNTAYNYSFQYLRRKPLDKGFIKDILYYTKRSIIK